jgi:hypothetical protein
MPRRRPDDASRAQRRCAASGCAVNTRDDMPYCTDHLEHMPYVARLRAKIASEQAEHERARERRASPVEVDGLTAQEIVRALRVNGDQTLRRLAQALGLEPALVDRYVHALASAGAVEIRQGGRDPVVMLRSAAALREIVG